MAAGHNIPGEYLIRSIRDHREDFLDKAWILQLRIQFIENCPVGLLDWEFQSIAAQARLRSPSGAAVHSCLLPDFEVPSAFGADDHAATQEVGARRVLSLPGGCATLGDLSEPRIHTDRQLRGNDAQTLDWRANPQVLIPLRNGWDAAASWPRFSGQAGERMSSLSSVRVRGPPANSSAVARRDADPAPETEMAEWVKREHGKGAIDRAGAFLVPWWSGQAKLDWGEIPEAYEIIENWRTSDAMPLLTFRMALGNRAKRVEPKAIVAQRLKRYSSVMNKLVREPQMKLSQMQDLGGCRAILSDVLTVERLFHAYRGTRKLFGMRLAGSATTTSGTPNRTVIEASTSSGGTPRGSRRTSLGMVIVSRFSSVRGSNTHSPRPSRQ